MTIIYSHQLIRTLCLYWPQYGYSSPHERLSTRTTCLQSSFTMVLSEGHQYMAFVAAHIFEISSDLPIGNEDP